MQLLLEHAKRRYYAGALRGPSDFVSPFNGRAYPCLLWDHSGSVSPAERSALADALIDSNCRYVVCGGAQCKVWHDAVDEAFTRRYWDASQTTQEELQLMTAWHSGETENDVASFFVMNTNFGTHVFREFLVLHVQGENAARERLEDSVRRAALGQSAA